MCYRVGSCTHIDKVCYALVQLSGGVLAEASDLGAGTSFTPVTFDLLEEASAPGVNLSRTPIVQYQLE